MDRPSPLDERVLQVFGALGESVVLPKGMALRLGGQGHVPRYVSEYLLAQRPRETAIAAIEDYLRSHHPLPRERNLWRHRLVQEGSLRIVDRLEVTVDVEDGSYVGRIASLDLKVRLDPALAEDHAGLLAGGLWGRIDLAWQPVAEGVPATLVRDFQPVQAHARLEPFLEGRSYFSAEGWIDLLLTSAGYDPVHLAQGLAADAALRRKLLLLMRLAPLVEGSLHLLELGPKNTGKTYLARNASQDAFVISGGAVTPANLFVHLTTGRPGLLAQRRMLAFDEIARLHLGGAEVAAALKDFLESGQFSRGRHEFSSDCSVVLLGNIDVEGDLPSRRYRHLCEPLPEELRDSAFLDRLHAFLPGWELPKLEPASFATGVGFVSDYFGEVLIALRDLPFAAEMDDLLRRHPLAPGMTRRDAVAVTRSAEALLKLIYPNGPTGDQGVLQAILTLAGELRQRIHDQLCRIAPGEFQPRRVGFQGVPQTVARDLEPAGPARVRTLAMAAGECLHLDRDAGAEAGGRLLRVEASLLATGRGLRSEGRLPPVAAEAERIAYSFLLANQRLLRLGQTGLEGRAVALQVAGGTVQDGPSLALPALLALVSALRGEAYLQSVVAAGESTLHGHLATPADILGRVGALRDTAPGVLVLGPLAENALQEVEHLLRSWRIVAAPTLAEAILALRA